jgi:predicted alpha/beta-hydrolase family hydrolase
MARNDALGSSGMATQPLFLFAHGAGASSTSKWMQQWKARLEVLGPVVTFDYPYMQNKRRSPDPLPKLIAAHREALQRAREGHSGAVFLIGKSMGSRVGCHVALEESVTGVICFGYPLKGQSGAVRSKVLEELRTPILFVQGTRDPLCPLDLLSATRRTMTARNELHIVESGNHSLEATRTHLKTAGLTQADMETNMLHVIRDFIASVTV